MVPPVEAYEAEGFIMRGSGNRNTTTLQKFNPIEIRLILLLNHLNHLAISTYKVEWLLHGLNQLGRGQKRRCDRRGHRHLHQQQLLLDTEHKMGIF